MRVIPHYPQVEQNFISVFWPNLPTGLQAAYEVTERDEVRFFKGNASAIVQLCELMFHVLWGLR